VKTNQAPQPGIWKVSHLFLSYHPKHLHLKAREWPASFTKLRDLGKVEATITTLPPSKCRDGIRHPFGVGPISAEVPLKQVRSHWGAWFAFCGDRAMTGTLREKPLFSHQTSYPLRGALDPPARTIPRECVGCQRQDPGCLSGKQRHERGGAGTIQGDGWGAGDFKNSTVVSSLSNFTLFTIAEIVCWFYASGNEELLPRNKERSEYASQMLSSDKKNLVYWVRNRYCIAAGIVPAHGRSINCPCVWRRANAKLSQCEFAA
jgi:hypothetical protein